MRALAIGLGCLLALSASSIPAAPVSVENIRTWPAPDHTRIVLDVDRPVEYALFVLRNPDRVVVDLRGARLLEEASRAARPGDRLLARIRAAQRRRAPERKARDGRRNDLRVVLDMKQRVRPKSFLLKPNRKYGHRLVIDLYPDRRRNGQDDGTQTDRRRRLREGNATLIIAVDAGHGGEDPGAVTRSGIREKDVVLAIARALARRIDRTPGMKAVMIRNGDYYVGLRRRTEIARKPRRGPVRLHPRRLVPEPAGIGKLRVRPLAPGSEQRGGKMARASRRMHPISSAASRSTTRTTCSPRCSSICSRRRPAARAPRSGGQVLKSLGRIGTQTQAAHRVRRLPGPEIARHSLRSWSRPAFSPTRPTRSGSPIPRHQDKRRASHSRRNPRLFRSQPTSRDHLRGGAAPHHRTRGETLSEIAVEVPGLGRAPARREPDQREASSGSATCCASPRRSDG